MEMMKKVADRHGLVCLLHEKPFAGVNGSGKHNNWSLATDNGINLLEPGKTPYGKRAVPAVPLRGNQGRWTSIRICSRMSVATAGNDHRLGANEAPPAVISMFIGEELTAILECDREGYRLQGPRSRAIWRSAWMCCPLFRRDTTDRNRTSPVRLYGQ